MTFDSQLRSLNIGMHSQHFDRYKLLALYKKKFKKSPKRGTPIQEIVKALASKTSS